MFTSKIHSWPGLNGSNRVPYAHVDGEIIHVHHLAGWVEGEETPMVLISRDHEDPIRAFPVNDRETRILNDAQTEYIYLSNKELLEMKVNSGEWRIA